MKLWVDDSKPAPPGWTHARTAEQAQRHLASGAVEELSLDHDLGFDQPDGAQIVRWMARSGHWPRKRPVIHTRNPAGRAFMERMVERYWKSSPG